MQTSSVLIVDDDKEDIDMFCEAVNELNSKIKCEWSLNASEALVILQNQTIQPDFIFLDLNMPGLNGKQFLQKIKKIKTLSTIPVYIYTTSKSTLDMEETEKLGSSGFIIKPYTYHELIDRLSGIFS